MYMHILNVYEDKSYDYVLRIHCKFVTRAGWCKSEMFPLSDFLIWGSFSIPSSPPLSFADSNRFVFATRPPPAICNRSNLCYVYAYPKSHLNTSEFSDREHLRLITPDAINNKNMYMKTPHQWGRI